MYNDILAQRVAKSDKIAAPYLKKCTVYFVQKALKSAPRTLQTNLHIPSATAKRASRYPTLRDLVQTP
jgi:hypothetical protein